MKSVRGDSVSGRRETGEAIASRANEVDTKPVKARLAAFLAAHAQHAKAEAAVQKASEAVRAKQALAGEIDATLDGYVDDMASLLPSVGLPRANPFKPLGLPAPSNLVKLAWKEEAKAAQKLAQKAAALRTATKDIKDLAKTIASTAAKLDATLDPIAEAEKAEKAAITARNTVGIEWERALGKLKNAARTAEDDGAHGLYEKLLGNPPARPKRAPRTKPTKDDPKSPT